jgi:hypothetical protein
MMTQKTLLSLRTVHTAFELILLSSALSVIQLLLTFLQGANIMQFTGADTCSVWPQSDGGITPC